MRVPLEIVVDMVEAMGGKEQNKKNDEESGYGMEIVFILSRAILVTLISILLGIIPSPMVCVPLTGFCPSLTHLMYNLVNFSFCVEIMQDSK